MSDDEAMKLRNEIRELLTGGQARRELRTLTNDYYIDVLERSRIRTDTAPAPSVNARVEDPKRK